MPVTPNILLQATTQAKTQAASANSSALTAEPGDKASSFSQVYANQSQAKPFAMADAPARPARDKAPEKTPDNAGKKDLSEAGGFVPGLSGQRRWIGGGGLSLGLSGGLKKNLSLIHI